MYAVIETGGKQYRVEVGTELEVELLDVEPGQSLTLERVLLVADGDEAAIGRPLVANAAVDAQVVRHDRGEKLISFKYRPKARRRVKKGHRQELTLLRITDVRLDGKSAAEARRKADEQAKTERERLEEAAARQAALDAELAARLAARTTAESAAEDAGKAAKPNEAKPKKRARAKTTEVKTQTEDGEPQTSEVAEAAATEADADASRQAGAEPASDEATGAVAADQPESANTDTAEAPKARRTKKSE